MSAHNNGSVPFDTLNNEEEILPKVKVSRKVLNQPHFEDHFESGDRYSKTLKERVQEVKEKCTLSTSCMKSFLLKIFPFIGIMSNYKPKEDLLGDVVSGLTVGIMHIPQGKQLFIIFNSNLSWVLNTIFPLYIFIYFIQYIYSHTNT